MSEMKNVELGLEVRQFLRTKDTGVLSTLKEQSDEVFPYGSICPYATLNTGEIAILVSDIAVHTKNMGNNGNVSFTVFEMATKNKQAGTRVSVLARAEKVDAKHPRLSELSDTYFRFYPEARRYLEVHDFDFFLLKPHFIHFIQGFGKIFTISANDYCYDDSISAKDYAFAIEHMNNDHQSSLEMFLGKIDVVASDPKIISMNSGGIHIKNLEDIYYFPFSKIAEAAKELREQIVAMTKLFSS